MTTLNSQFMMVMLSRVNETVLELLKSEEVQLLILENGRWEKDMEKY